MNATQRIIDGINLMELTDHLDNYSERESKQIIRELMELLSLRDDQIKGLTKELIETKTKLTALERLIKRNSN